ncbi:MAG TPA: hypothetical protein V6D09_11440 [Leptolyngbyaceae cyanobacterium]
MYSVQQYKAATTESNAPESPRIEITVPQRKARSHDKNRIKWIDAKRLALIASGCADTAEVRKWLKHLNVRTLRLTMTSAWVAICHDLATKIKIARNKLAPDAAKVVDLIGYKQGARSLKDCARNWAAIEEHRQLERQNNINIVLIAMKDAIAASNWEFLRQALVSREKYKADAWRLLTTTEKNAIEAIVPVEIKLLKAALKQGAIAAFKEDDEGGIFWIWHTDINSEPELVSGTTVRNFYGIS